MISEPWAAWKFFPDPRSGEYLDAPFGPGVFEVRDIETGEQVAFAPSRNVARSLATLMPPSRSGLRALFPHRTRLMHPGHELEYRTRPARTIREAKAIVACLNGRRHVAVVSLGRG
jgi:hypothetical protein